jgi:hypothetical protein
VALGSDPYAVLGIARDATDAQIAQARHQLVREYHPDVNHHSDAAGRFEDVQQAFDLLSDPAARAEYDRTHDIQGQVLVMRAADGGYGLGGGAAAGALIEPASVDFGVLTLQRPWADARVTVAWSGATWPGDFTRNVGNDWWRVMDFASPATSCIVFRLRAAAHSGGPKGQQHDQFTVTVNDTVLTADLSAEFQGDFSAVTKPDFDLPKPRGRGIQRGELGAVSFAVCLSGILLLGVMPATHASWMLDILVAVAWLLSFTMTIRRDLRRRDAKTRDEDRDS